MHATLAILAVLAAAAPLQAQGTLPAGKKEPGKEVAVEGRELLLPDPPGAGPAAREGVLGILREGYANLSYLNGYLAETYQAQQKDMAEGTSHPETLGEPLAPELDELRLEILARLQAKEPLALGTAYQDAFEATLSGFMTNLAAVEPAPFKDRFATPSPLGPAKARLEELFNQVEILSGSQRPVLTEPEIDRIASASVDMSLTKVYEELVARAGSITLPADLAAMNLRWPPFKKVLAQLSLDTSTLLKDLPDGPFPLRIRLLRRALKIHLYERLRGAMADNLGLWLAAAVSNPKGTRSQDLGNETDSRLRMDNALRMRPKRM
jgi:hypothetical protein